MGALKGMAVRLRAWLRRDLAERELDDEIHFHLEMEAEKYARLGMSPAEARRRALVAFGGVTRHKEAHREVRGVRWLEELAADTRYALRTLRRSPGLAAAAIVTLALGVGANTAIFSAVNAVILRPLPFPTPDRLVMLWEENPEKGWYKQVAAPANYFDWRERVPAFQDVAAYTGGRGHATITGGCAGAGVAGAAGACEPRVIHASDVTGNFFAVLGVRAALGRTLRDEETWKTGTPPVVVSHRLWRERFGARPDAIGRTVQINGRPAQVVGVMPADFAFPDEEVDLWAPHGWDPAARAQVWFRRAHWLYVVARLRPGVSLETANAELQHVAAQLKREYAETNRVMGAGMTPLHEFLVGDTRLPLLVLLAAVALLLLIACANVGNLLLVRALGREREVSLRLALGAGRGRLVRQALTESLVLSALGGAAGLALGWWGTRALLALQPAGMLRVRDFGVDWGVLAYVLGITVASGLVFGTAPAAWNGRRAPAEALKEGTRTGSEGRRMRRWGDALVVAEVAIALLLTVGAGLLVRSFWELRRVNPGFDANGVLTAWLEVPDARYDTPEKLTAFFDELLRRVRALPGVDEAAAVSVLPLTGTGWSSDFTAAGRAPGDYGVEVVHRVASPDYFRTMRVPVLRGRAFTDADRLGAPRVVIVNDALARSYFRGQDPVGQRITFDRVPDSTSIWRTIVGVVGNERQAGMAAEPRIEIFAPLAQEGWNAVTLVVRTRADPASLAPAIRRAVAELDPNLALATARPMAAIRADSLARDRFLMTLLLVFAAVGLLLAVVGVYGVLAHAARRRTREMGIRIALGAQAAQVRWLVVRHGLRLVGAGLAIGGAAALLATRALRGLLYLVPPADPATFAAVAALLALTGAMASWVPAMRASRADPASALRTE